MPETDQPQKSTLDKYWKGLTWSLFSIIFRVLIGIGSSIIFIRYLGDKGYGSVVVMADFITLSIVLLSMGLGVVQTRVLPQLLVKKQYGTAKDFIFKIFTVRIVLSLLLPIIIYRNLSSIINTIYPGIPEKLMLIALLLIPIQMLVFCLRSTLEATFHQKEISLIDISGLIFRLILAVPVIIFDLGLLWFFFTQLLADIYLIILYSRTFITHIWKQLKFAQRDTFTGKIWSVGFLMMLTLLCNRFLGKEMDTQILSFRLHETALSEIAIYSISFMLVLRSLSFIGVGSGGISNLNQSMMSELVAVGNIEAIRETYSNQIQIFYFISIPLIFGSLILAEPILVLMYGNSFVGNGKICSILFLGFGGTVINHLNYPVIFAHGYENKLLVGRAFWGCSNVIASFYLATHGAIGVASATSTCLLGVALYETAIVYKLISPRIPLIFFVKTIMGSTFMTAIVFILFKLISIDFAIIKVAGSVIWGATCYYLIMCLLKPLEPKVIENFTNLPKGLLFFASRMAK